MSYVLPPYVGFSLNRESVSLSKSEDDERTSFATLSPFTKPNLNAHIPLRGEFPLLNYLARAAKAISLGQMIPIDRTKKGKLIWQQLNKSVWRGLPEALDRLFSLPDLSGKREVKAAASEFVDVNLFFFGTKVEEQLVDEVLRYYESHRGKDVTKLYVDAL